MIENILVGGVNVSVFESISDVISNGIIVGDIVKPGMAVAVNPEKIIIAKTDAVLMDILQKSTLNYPDGIGVSYVMSKKRGKKVARIPGCELWEQLMITSAKIQIPVFLVGASENVISDTCDKLLLKNVNVVGFHNGYFDSQSTIDVINQIIASKAKIVSVALGSPRQEHFIFECMKYLPETFFMGVGGTYDVFTGNVKRAPWIFRKLNVEWLYRLLSQPIRGSRQKNLLIYIKLYLLGKL